MKKSTMRIAAVVLCGCILAGCSSSSEETKKKKKSKKTTAHEETEIDKSSDEEPSEDTSNEPETSPTTEEPTSEESTTTLPSEESTDEAPLKSDWLFDDSYFTASQTPEGKASFGSAALCPSYEFCYNLQYNSAISKDFTADDPQNLDDYYFGQYLFQEEGDRIDGYMSIHYIPNDPNSPFKSFDIMIFEEIPFDPPTETYVIIELKENVGNNVYTREFQEMLYPYIEALYGKNMADIMMYSSEEALGVMRRIMHVEGYARAPEYRIKRLVNTHYLEFFLQESTRYNNQNDLDFDDYTEPT